MYRYLKSYQRTRELSTVLIFSSLPSIALNNALNMDPKRLIQHNYLAVIAFLVLALAWLEQPPSIARADVFEGLTHRADSTAEGWGFPLEQPVRLVKGFQKPNSDYSAGHRGVDLAAELGQAIFAPTSGTISFAGTVVNREVVTLLHDDGKLISFEPACSDSLVGEKVGKGEVFGWICEPNETYIQHCGLQRCLHYSVRLAGEYLSPLSFLGEQTPSRLLALKP
jgi:hypothetical protein